MEEGSLRADANVSVRPAGRAGLGTKTELKNMNSFRFLERGIDAEIARQTALLEAGGRVVQETLHFDPDTGEIHSLRSKEEAHDYRYFPEPDLVPLAPDRAWVEELRAALPELPADAPAAAGGAGPHLRGRRGALRDARAGRLLRGASPSWRSRRRRRTGSAASCAPSCASWARSPGRAASPPSASRS